MMEILTTARGRVVTFAPHTKHDFHILDLTSFWTFKRVAKYHLSFYDFIVFFGSAKDTRFLLDEDTRESVKSMCCVVYRYERWTMVVDLLLCFISRRVPEADAQRVVSMQKMPQAFTKHDLGLR
jgi:hypothetical protein